ncbi:MAG: acyl-CoA synthetase FdrA [Propionicimonas sp.]
MTSSSVLEARVFPRLYRDSVNLMALASALEKAEGVIRVGAVMGTPANLEILERSQMLPEELAAIPDDLVIVVRGVDQAAVTAALGTAAASLTEVREDRPASRPSPATVAEGIAAATKAGREPNLVAISVPGMYAAVVSEQALRRGLHVFCFSDNMAIEDEVRLKRLAVDSGLLLMGPDCGTAIVDGRPLGFANVVRSGSVGIVAASGTGAQEVSCLLDRAGAGISQLIGVGGRDLSASVGGLMTRHAVRLLAADNDTGAIVVVSKPPAPEVADRLLAELARAGKPAVACLLGMDDAEGPVQVRGTLEGGARAAAELLGLSLPIADPPVATGPARRVLGLFAGGTLASEAKVLLDGAGVEAEVVDLGADEYTVGRPHPMIDPGYRTECIAAAGSRPEVGVLLLDVVLGHAASAEPTLPLIEAIGIARAAARDDGRELVVVASVCGTGGDPQGLARQRELLESAGVIVCDSNASAARTAAVLAGAVQNAVEGESR